MTKTPSTLLREHDLSVGVGWGCLRAVCHMINATVQYLPDMIALLDQNGLALIKLTVATVNIRNASFDSREC